MYNVYKKYKKESSHSKSITKSNDNVFLEVYYYVRLCTILVSMLFCNRDITQSRCIGKRKACSTGSHILKGAM
jgi:hypothetical protein